MGGYELFIDLKALGFWQWSAPKMFCWLSNPDKGSCEMLPGDLFFVLGWTWHEEPEWNSVYYHCMNNNGVLFFIPTHDLTQYSFKL